MVKVAKKMKATTKGREIRHAAAQVTEAAKRYESLKVQVKKLRSEHGTQKEKLENTMLLIRNKRVDVLVAQKEASEKRIALKELRVKLAS